MTETRIHGRSAGFDGAPKTHTRSPTGHVTTVPTRGRLRPWHSVGRYHEHSAGVLAPGVWHAVGAKRRRFSADARTPPHRSDRCPERRG